MSEELSWNSVEKLLKAPFPPSEVEWRVQSGKMGQNGPTARVLAYLNNRAIEHRLDDVFGLGLWQNDFKELSNGGFLCGIGCSLDGETWIWKWDGADNTNIEATKGGISSAMKRAAQQWSIGRYLYYLEAGWATFHSGGKESAKINNQWYNWDPPELPAWALPKEEPAQKEEAAQPYKDF